MQQYQAGGNVGVYPENDRASVEKFAKRMDLDMEEVFQITMKGSIK